MSSLKNKRKEKLNSLQAKFRENKETLEIAWLENGSVYLQINECMATKMAL